MTFINDRPLGNFFSERGFLICTEDEGANFYKKLLVPIVEYIKKNPDTSDFRNKDSDLMKYINHYMCNDTHQNIHLHYWKVKSSIKRVLPIAYFEWENGKEYLRLSPIAESLYEGKISPKQFLFYWFLRFQGFDYSNNKIVTKSNLNLVEAFVGKGKENLEKRIVKPGILAIKVLRKLKDKNKVFMTDKEFRNMKYLLDQRDEDSIDLLVDKIISDGELDVGSQEEPLFKVLQYLGFCNIYPNKKYNPKYTLTQYGYDLSVLLEKYDFTYCHKSATTSQYINYFEGLPSNSEKELLEKMDIKGGRY